MKPLTSVRKRIRKIMAAKPFVRSMKRVNDPNEWRKKHAADCTVDQGVCNCEVSKRG